MDLDRAVHFLSLLRIRDRESKIVPFVLNPSQTLIIEKLREAASEGKPPWCIVLKARQVGVSTLSEGLLTAHCVSQPNGRALLLAHQFKSSKKLFEAAALMRQSIPIEMPSGTQHRLEFPHYEGNATLDVVTAGSQDIGRGLSLSACHFSEAASYPNEAEAFTSLLPAIPYKESTIVIVESTAKGKVGDGETFYRMWCDSLEGRSQFVPIFIPWTLDPACVWDEETAQDAPADEEEEDLVKEGVTIAQLAWRRMMIATVCKGSVDIFHQEYPRVWEEAFISYENSAFDSKERRWAKHWVNHASHPEKKIIFIRERISPDDPKDQRTRIVFERAKKDAPGAVSIWEEPDKKSKYYIGGDAARGDKTGDYSAFVGWNGSTGDQAFRFAAKVGPVELANQLDMVGRTYGNAMVNIEVTGGYGAWAQKVLRDTLTYPNIYRWKGSADDSMPGKGVKQALGWETTYRSRKNLFAAFREALRYHKMRIFDEMLFVQIESAVFDEFGRWELDYGHDDVLMAAMIGWITSEQYPPPRKFGAAARAMLYNGDEADYLDDEKFEQGKLEDGRIIFENDPLQRLKRHWYAVRRPTRKNRLSGI